MNGQIKGEMVRFSVKGRVVIPRRLRKEFGIEAGAKAYVEVVPEGILLRPVTEKSIRGLRGALKGAGVLNALMEARKADREL